MGPYFRGRGRESYAGYVMATEWHSFKNYSWPSNFLYWFEDVCWRYEGVRKC